MNLEKFVENNAPRNRIALLAITDIFLIALSGFLALYIRYDFRFSKMDMQYVDYEMQYLPVSIVVTLVLFVLFKLYRSVWRFASSAELLNVIGACSCQHDPADHRDGPSGNADAGQLLPDEVCDPDRRRGPVRFAYRILRMLQERRLFGGRRIPERIP